MKTTGDGVLAEFGSAVDAVSCAVEIQRRMADPNRQRTGLAIAAVVIAALVGALGWQATRLPTVEAAVVEDKAFALPDKPSLP